MFVLLRDIYDPRVALPHASSHGKALNRCCRVAVERQINAAPSLVGAADAVNKIRCKSGTAFIKSARMTRSSSMVRSSIHISSSGSTDITNVT